MPLDVFSVADGQIFTEGINSEANIKEHWWTNYLDRRNLKGAAFFCRRNFSRPEMDRKQGRALFGPSLWNQSTKLSDATIAATEKLGSTQERSLNSH